MTTRSILAGPHSFLVLGGAVGLLAIPSAVLGLSAGFDPARVMASAQSGLDSLSDDALETADARAVMLRSLARPSHSGDLFSVTPGRADPRAHTGLSIAVRVDPSNARAIQTRPGDAPSAMRMSQSAYNLAVTRGTKSFSDNLVAADKQDDQPLANMTAFKLSPGAKDGPSRFAPVVEIDERQRAGRAPRTFDGDGEARVDLGGSYSLSSSVAVTAGVRYRQADRDRLVPIADGRKDDQAVYVGTRLKF